LVLAAPACQLFGDQPAAAPSEQTTARVIAPPAPLPPEEVPPEEPVIEAPRAEAKPVEPGITSTGAPTRGKLPKEVVDEKLEAAQPDIGACYEAELKTKPDLRGVVNIRFVVGTDGKVAYAEASEAEGALADSAAVDCIVSVIKKLEFPEPSGGRVFLDYPLRLEPAK
jgi:hypothetical protein